MRKKPLLLLAGLGLLGVTTLLVLQNYQLDLIHYIVVHALLQKAPQSEGEEIRSTFEQARRRAEREGKQDVYLRRLLAFSQRLEKVQEVSPESLRRMLAEARAFDQPLEDPDAVR